MRWPFVSVGRLDDLKERIEFQEKQIRALTRSLISLKKEGATVDRPTFHTLDEDTFVPPETVMTIPPEVDSAIAQVSGVNQNMKEHLRSFARERLRSGGHMDEILQEIRQGDQRFEGVWLN